MLPFIILTALLMYRLQSSLDCQPSLTLTVPSPTQRNTMTLQQSHAQPSYPPKKSAQPVWPSLASPSPPFPSISRTAPLTSQLSRRPSPAQSPSVLAAAIRRTFTHPLTDQRPPSPLQVPLSVQLLLRLRLSARIVSGLCAWACRQWVQFADALRRQPQLPQRFHVEGIVPRDVGLSLLLLLSRRIVSKERRRMRLGKV
jgi:hypothetical protein